MLDAALINDCADPSLKPAIVEQFIEAVGSDDPLAITVRAAGRLILVPKPKTPAEAIEIVRENIERSNVRVGLTQFPVAVGHTGVSELKPDLVEPCSNLRIGTAMFARILRIVARWYGNPTSDEVFPQLFDDAVHSWKTGEFEGQNVFQAQYPGGAIMQTEPGFSAPVGEVDGAEAGPNEPSQILSEPDDAGIRIDLRRINGQK